MREKSEWGTFVERLEEGKATPEEVEAYYQGIDDMLSLFFDRGHCKHYDPLTIVGNEAHTYLWDLWDGGRHHKFESLKQLVQWGRHEAMRLVQEEVAHEGTLRLRPDPYLLKYFTPDDIATTAKASG